MMERRKSIMRKRRKAFWALFLSAAIVASQPVLAADFSDGEEVFVTEITADGTEVQTIDSVFTEEAGAAVTAKEYDATVSEEICDLGQWGEEYDDWRLSGHIEIKNTGTKAWHIKSISDLKYFQRRPFIGTMEIGSKVEPGECIGTKFYAKVNLPKGLHEETFVMETEEGIHVKCRVRVRIGGESGQDYEIVCEPSSGTSFPVITQEEYDSWDDVDPDPDMLMCPSRSIFIRNNGQKPITVDFENTEHFRAWFYDDQDTGVVMPGEYTTIQVFPKAHEQVATDIFKVSITGGIELSYTVSQNCPHIPPAYPDPTEIRDISVQGAVVKAVVHDCENSEGFDAVLTKKSWNLRPENYIKVVKNQSGKTITFTNVKNGTYYLGVHAYNRDYYNGKVSDKRFGRWSYPRKVVVTNGIPAGTPKIKSVKTGKRSVSLTVAIPKGFERMDAVLESTNGANVYKRSNQKTSAKFTGVNPGTYRLKIRPWLKINGKKTYGDWVSWPKKIQIK